MQAKERSQGGIRVARLATGPVTNWQALFAEGRQLRFGFIQAELDLGFTLAAMAEAWYKMQNRVTAESSLKLARRSYETALNLLSKTKGMPSDQIGTLRSKADGLRAVLLALESGTPDNVPVLPGSNVEAVPAPDSPSSTAAAAARSVSVPSQERLTNREVEVLKCIVQGHSTKQVAALLGMSFKTAVCHRYRLMGKLGIHDSVGLVWYAIRSGLVNLQ